MKIDFYTDTVKKNNEDICGITKTGAFVIDGASALTDKNYTPSGNDVNWMVQWWKAYLEENLDDTNSSIQSILKEGINRFNNEYGKFVDIQSLKPYEKLSAAIAILRQNAERLEAYVLGDVQILIEDKTREQQVITDDKLNFFDQQVIELIQRTEKRKDRIVFKGFTREELDLLIKNRSKMNQPGGYYILSHCPEAVDHGIYRTFSVDSIEKCLLATDGLEPLHTKYSRKSLFEKVKEKGAKGLIQELRKLEKSDLDKTGIGRLKTHDDATLIYLDFGWS